MALVNPEQVLQQTFVEHVEHRPEVDSTNNVALRLAARDTIATPFVVIAEHQRAGRGRGQNRWWSSTGAVTLTVVVDGAASKIPIQNWSQISLATGLATCEAIRELVPNERPQLKWPNDVYLRSRKVCGILVETSPVRPGLIAIGVGVNVNNRLTTAPAEIQATATSLAEVAKTDFDRTQFSVLLLQRIERSLRQLESNTLALSDSWRSLCMLQGRTLRVDAGNLTLIGVCQGIDDEGALLLHTDSGVQRCFAGVVAKIY
jgi:BirA family biotin operon repressor/biotin-[acetyl-CoA-carboxylase] ligase